MLVLKVVNLWLGYGLIGWNLKIGMNVWKKF